MSDQPLDSPWRDRRRNVEINIGKSCNSRCVFCLDGDPSERDAAFMPFEQMTAELERWYAEGYRSVGFLGGEPTLYPQIVEAVAHAAGLGYTRITLATNALRLQRQQLVDDLVAAGLTRVTISMHGHTARLEDALTRVPGAFQKKCQAIASLRRYRAVGKLADGLSVNLVLNGYNYRHLPKMMQFFFDELELDDMRVNFVRPEGRAEGDAALTPRYTTVVPVLMKAIALNEYHFGRVFTFGGFPMCVLPAQLLQARNLLRKYMGDVYRDLSTACSIRSEGYDDGVSRVQGGRARFDWQERKRHDLKHRPQVCLDCDVSEICEGVWRNYLQLHGPAEFCALRRAGDALSRREP